MGDRRRRVQADSRRWIGVAVVAGAALAYSAFMVWLQSSAAYENDELFTLYFSRLPGMGDVWEQLRTGVEQTPPFFYLVTRISLHALGDGGTGLRLPALAGVLLAATCALVAVARRSSLRYGCIAALLLLCSQATFYAHEARPYGLALGLVAAGFLCWQIHGDSRGLPVAGVLMGVSLTAAVATHYYAVLALAPIVLGEGVRTLQRRRLDPVVVAGLLAALVPLVVARPLIQAARAYSDSFWTELTWSSAVEFNGWLFRTSAVSGRVAPRLELSLLVWVLCGLAVHALVSSRGPRRPGPRAARAAGSRTDRTAVPAAAVPAVGIVALLAHAAIARTIQSGGFALLGVGAVVAYVVFSRGRSEELRRRASAWPVGLPETVALASFLILPPLAVALAQLVTGAYTPRYVLPAGLGVAMLLPLGLQRMCGHRRAVPAAVLVVLLALAVRVAWYQHLELDEVAAERATFASFLDRHAPAGSPVVVGHPRHYLELAQDPSLRRRHRLLHLASPDLAARYVGTDSTEAGLLVMRRFAPLDVRRFEPFVAARRPFLLLVTPDASDWNWILPALAASDRTTETVARDDGIALLRVG